MLFVFETNHGVSCSWRELLRARGCCSMLFKHQCLGNLPRFLFHSTILLLIPVCVETVKLRSWLGPGMFVEGQAPAGRGTGQILAAYHENVYVFGGTAGSKYLNDLHIYHSRSRTWADVSEHVEGTRPSPRYGHAFIAASEKLFLFGGRSSLGYLNDLFTLDPARLRWTDVTALARGRAPSPRTGCFFAALGGRIYIFGGWSEVTLRFFNDLYVLDPVALEWTDLTNSVQGQTPPPVSGHCFVALGNRLYVFGGAVRVSESKVGHTNRLFSFDPANNTWAELTASIGGARPFGRKDGAAAVLGGRMWLFGGWTDNPAVGPYGGVLNDVHVYDPAAGGAAAGAWFGPLQAASPPQARAGHYMVAANGRMYSFGGYTDWPVVYMGDLHSLADGSGGGAPVAVWTSLSNKFNGYFASPTTSVSTATEDGLHVTTRITTEKLLQLNPRTAYHGLASFRGCLYLFGGREAPGSFTADLHEWDEETLAWRSDRRGSGVKDLGASTAPSARAHHGFVAGPEGLYTFGGEGYEGLLSDLHLFNTGNLSWVQLSHSPTSKRPVSRKGHGFEILGQNLYSFGGLGNAGLLADLWVFNTVAGNWTDLTTSFSGNVPPARVFHGFAASNEMLFVFGGKDDRDFLGDLHCWNPSSGVWTDLTAQTGGDTAPRPRAYHAFASHHNFIYVFGGWGSSGFLNDLYTLSPSSMTWKDRTSSLLGSQPFARYGHALASIGDFLYMTGGIALSGDFLDEVHVIPTPRVAMWPKESEFIVGFIDIFDWDFVQLHNSSSAFSNKMPALLPLCTRGLPCVLSVLGGEAATPLLRTGSGGIICNALDRCSMLSVVAVTFECDSQPSDCAPLRVDGSGMLVTESVFNSCIAKTDGGSIQALEADVQITGTTFRNSYSYGSGGAVNLVGSRADMQNNSFVNCSAFSDGGGLSIIDYQCTSSTRLFGNTLVKNSFFYGCSSERGGAVSARSGEVLVINSVFKNCKSTTSGGAIYVSDGAEAVHFSGIDSVFEINSAQGTGGGAMYLANENSILGGVSCSHNMAPYGGGGVVMWEKAGPSIMCGTGASHSNFDGICLPCQPGSFQSGLGGSTCDACGAGSFSEKLGSSSCSLCKPGKYSDVAGLINGALCKDCAAGSYQSGSGLTRKSNCLMCPSGSFASNMGSTVCVRCKAGTFSTILGSNSSNYCSNLCPAGTFSAGGASTCVECLAGKYSTGLGIPALSVVSKDSDNFSPCQICSAGKFSSSSGLTRPEVCKSGSFSREGWSACTFCFPGSFAERNESSACEHCAIDTYSDFFGASTCTLCPSGFITILPFADLSCTSTGNNTLCSMNTKCIGPSCARGTVGRYIPGEAYDNDELMTWVVAGLKGATVLLTFTVFNIEDIYDSVIVYNCTDATCAEQTIIGTFSGANLPAKPVNSSTGVMKIVWNGLDHCCPKPSVMCSCDNPQSASLLTGWAAEFAVLTTNTCWNQSVADGFRPRTIAVSGSTETRMISESIPKNRISHSVAEMANLMLLNKQRFPGFEARSLYPSSVLIGELFKFNLFSGIDQNTIGAQDMIVDFNLFSNIPERTDVITEDFFRKSFTQMESRNSSRLYHRITFPFLKPGFARRSLERSNLVCGPGNHAAYGNCMASTFKQLAIAGPRLPLYPGIPFSVSVYKIDAYNQTIVVDSSTVLQVYAASYRGQLIGNNPELSILGPSIVRMQQGAAEFVISVKPPFKRIDAALQITDLVSIPAIYFEGFDASAPSDLSRMRSQDFEIRLQSGNNICPPGYILSLDESPSIGGARSGLCSFCMPGTYTISALSGGSNTSSPSCVACPIQATQLGDCESGGKTVNFSLGRWLVSDGLYRLVECPSGFQLINSVDGSFSNQIQRCDRCGLNEYVLDSSNPAYICKSCPKFMICNNTSVEPRLEGTAWEIDYQAGLYRLIGCPPGFEKDEEGQDCDLCQPLYYCAGSSFPKSKCPLSTFSFAGANSSLYCMPAVFVNLVVLLPLSVQDFDSNKQNRFLTATAAAARLNPDRVIITSITQSTRRMSSIELQMKLAATDQSHAESVSSRITEAVLNDQLAANGLPDSKLKIIGIGDSVTVVISGLGPAEVAGLAVGMVGLLLMIGVALWFRHRRIESEDERALRLEIMALRTKLGLNQKDGFYMSSEAVPIWLRREQIVFILRREMEAAARLSLSLEFDIKSFDAFCHCLEYSSFVLKITDLSGNGRSPQYVALCDWLLQVCTALVEPPVLKKKRQPSANLKTNEIDTVVDFDDQQATAARGRFIFFQRFVIRCSIWQDHNKQLWKKLKKIAASFMDEMATLCDARFEQLCDEPCADKLLVFGRSSTHLTLDRECKSLHNKLFGAADKQNIQSFESSKSMLQVHDAKDGDSFCRSKSSAYDGSVPIRQDDKMVNAITVSDESRREAQFERENLMSEDRVPLFVDGQSQDEEVFIAQLHRRARLLNDGFQRRVLGIVVSHSRKAVPADKGIMEPMYFSSSAVESQLLFPAESQQPASAGQHSVALQESQEDSRGLYVHPKHPVYESSINAAVGSGSNAAVGSCSLMFVSGENQSSSQIQHIRRPSWERQLSLPGFSQQSPEGRLAPAIISSPSILQTELSRVPAMTISSVNHQMQYRTSSSTTFSVSFTEFMDAGSSDMITCEFIEGDALVEVHHGAIKTVQRMREKLAEYAAEGSPWPHSAAILDPVRLSIVCTGPSQIVQAANWFMSESNSNAGGEKELPVLRVKNKFAFAPEDLKGGYRDLMLSVLYEEADTCLRIIGEIQIQDTELFNLKRQMHRLYKIQRSTGPDAL